MPQMLPTCRYQFGLDRRKPDGTISWVYPWTAYPETSTIDVSMTITGSRGWPEDDHAQVKDHSGFVSAKVTGTISADTAPSILQRCRTGLILLFTWEAPRRAGTTYRVLIKKPDGTLCRR